MKLTQITVRPIVYKLMAEMGLPERPAIPDGITKITQAVLAEAVGRKAEPLTPMPFAPKLVVPECPDEASAKEALFKVYRPFVLQIRLTEIPSCHYWLIADYKRPIIVIEATFAHYDQIRQVLAEFGICPAHRKRPPRDRARPSSCTLRLNVRLPRDWWVREPLPDDPTKATGCAALTSLKMRLIRRSTPFVNENCYRDGKGRLRCRHCDGPVRGPVGCRRCEDCGECEETHRVQEMMGEGWPGAVDWNVVDNDHVEILDSRDNVLAVITSDDLTRMWNDL
jgi:hypothetical protein